MRLHTIATAAVLAFSAAAASAANTSWGEHPAAKMGTGFAEGAGTLISDTFSFTLSNPSSLLAVGVSNDGFGFNLTGGTVSLFLDSNPVAIGAFSFDSVAVSHTFGALPVGNYHYLVTATVADGAVAGNYLLNSQIAPVPEPESYALMLAGLGAVGFMARRRKTV